jgi:thiamine transporter ThiT
MDETADDYHHGEMPVTAQAHTYATFGKLTKWVSLHIAVLMVIFILWFCTGAGFVAGLIAGLVVWGAGVFFLRSKPTTDAH